MSITTALKARREALRDREAGFTLIELLVVVIIIGILAAIAIPIYIGVQNNAKDSAVKSDLNSDKTAIVSFATSNNGSLPAAPLATSLAKYGYVQSTNDTTITYTQGAAGSANANLFCLLATSSTGNKFYVTSNSAIAGGSTSSACPATY